VSRYYAPIGGRDMQKKKCTRCGEAKPATREFFGSTPSGVLRGYCRTCMNKASAEYERNNKDRRRKRDAKCASIDRDARAGFDDSTKRALLKRQAGLCPCCFLPITSISLADVDHATPLAKGGVHHPSNFMLAHAQCNKEKHNKTLPEHWEWRVRVGLDPENLGRKHGLIP
jgi:5-methylcytosine-specific restriction endonuclease McrA